MARVLFLCSGGRFCQSSILLLFQNFKFQLGYARYFAALSVAATRAILGHAAVPHPIVGWAFLAAVCAELLEDLACMCMGICGLSAQPKFPKLSEEAAAQRAERMIQAEQSPNAAAQCCCCMRQRRQRVVPSDGTAARYDEHWHEQQVAQRTAQLLAVHYFDTSCAMNSALPLWAHFVVVYPGLLLHMLVLLWFAGEVSSLLGICDHIDAGSVYTGIGRGLVWWPVMDPTNPCN